MNRHIQIGGLSIYSTNLQNQRLESQLPIIPRHQQSQKIDGDSLES